VPTLLIAALLGPSARQARPSPDSEPTEEARKFFEMRVRPVLAENCQKCHGPDTQKGGLRLDSRAAILAGGDSGPAVVPGEVEESLIVEAIRHDGLRMPPKGKLGDDQVRDIQTWIEIGAPWPGEAKVETASPARGFSDDDRAWWAIQPLRVVDVPAAGDGWARNEVDRFLLTKLRERGLTPAPEADGRTLIRRATFDLTGLPPTIEEVETFVNDPEPDAYERLVDRLLDSPRYGERWTRHWLDLVRWAESDGYRQDAFRPQAWRYRDYVIRSLNDDKPYDRFVAEQLAGDELAPGDPEMRVATQFLRLWAYEFNQRDVPSQWDAILNDLTDVTGDVFLGLGMGCARCHDHKFDPILRRDYYRLQAFFRPLLPRDDQPQSADAASADYFVSKAAWDVMTAEVRAEIDAIERPHREAAQRDAIAKFQPDIQAILRMPDHERTPAQRQFAYLGERQLVEEFGKIDGRVKGKEKDLLAGLYKRLAEFDRYKPKAPAPAFTATDVGPESPPMVMPGDRRAEPIEPGFLSILDPAPAALETPPPGLDTTGRRLTLARWLTSPDNPLATRVIVNRIWQYHFGRGLVATASDFGRLGETPSHPELLDWLARRFVEDGWSLKRLHRLLMTSAAYRQAAIRPPAEVAEALRIDPENRLLWRRTTSRLDAEPIRDAMLAASGELDLTTGGPSVEPEGPRRTIYTKAIRNKHDPLLDAFDAPDGSASVARRNVTTTPMQSLLLINGPWTLARAREFAERLRREEPGDAGRQIDLAYRLAFGRPPGETEREEALAFLDRQARPHPPAAEAAGCEDEAKAATSAMGSEAEALVDLCHALLNSNEFLYVD
jgi:mono/diheme cytochrome c family protein